MRGLFQVNKAEMARLRLQAGCCMLKLAQEPQFADKISLEQFQTIALLLNVSININDSILHNR